MKRMRSGQGKEGGSERRGGKEEGKGAAGVEEGNWRGEGEDDGRERVKKGKKDGK